MLARIIEWSINNKFFVILGTIAVVGFGGWAMVTTPVDAIPDLSDVQVIVQTEWRGQAPQVVVTRSIFLCSPRWAQRIPRDESAPVSSRRSP